MNNGILIIWLAILIISFIRRAATRSRSGRDGMTAVPQKSASVQPAVEQVRKKPVRVSQSMMQEHGAQRRMAERFGKKAPDATCETQYGHVHPERGGSAMRFIGRPDLEPGYMYLNGVKVLIKEADRLEFLK